jgi:hypothetical protein
MGDLWICRLCVEVFDVQKYVSGPGDGTKSSTRMCLRGEEGYESTQRADFVREGIADIM